MTLLGGFVLSLFFVSCFTLIQAEGTLGAGFVLFFKVIGFLFLPLGLVLIGTGLGRWILQILDLVEEVRPMI